MSKHMLNAIFIFIAFLITCVAIATGSYFNAGLIMQVGSPSEIRVRAPRDTEDIAETARNREAARILAEGLDEVYTINPNVWDTVQNNLSLLRDAIENIREEYLLELTANTEAIAEWEEQNSIHNEIVDRINEEWQAQVIEARAEGSPSRAARNPARAGTPRMGRRGFFIVCEFAYRLF